MNRDIDCRPYTPPAPDTEPHTILEYASRASDAANRYRDAMQSRANFKETLRASGALAAATERLTIAIADAVAAGDNTLS